MLVMWSISGSKDGTSASANLVVGCDGIRSYIRSQFVSDNPIYSGRIAYRGSSVH